MRIDNESLAILSRVECSGNTAKIVERLDRPTYTKVNKFLEMMGGKWNRKAQAHVFEDDPADRITDAVALGEIVDPKKEIQFFETPPELAARMARFAELTHTDRVLEPSAGKGALVRAIINENHHCELVLVEKDPGNCAYLRQLHPDLEWEQAIINADFLTFMEDPKFDKIVMNPPFRNAQDIAHINHAYRNLLKPGGILVAITSPGWTFRQDKRHSEFRQWVEECAESQPLEEGTFKESGTMIRTCLLIAHKPE